MRRPSVRASTLAVIAALLLAVGAGVAGSTLAQADGHDSEAFLDEDGDRIAADRPADGAATAEPALVSAETLGAVGAAVAVALLVVAAVRRADG